MHSLHGGPVYARPWWAKLAYSRGWMDADEYYDIDEEPTGEVRPSFDLLYAESPFMALIRKQPSQETA